MDGEGTLLTTEEVMLKRNPELSKTDMEKIFKDYLGVTKVIWLPRGVYMDEVGGHVVFMVVR